MIPLIVSIYVAIVAFPSVYVLATNDATFSAYTAAQYLGLLGAAMLFLQLTLAARYRWLERSVGLDRLLRWHKWSGIVGLSLVLLHPILFSVYYQQFGWEIHWEFLKPGWKWETLGMVSLDFMTILVVVAIFNRWIKLPYHWWKRTHQLIYLGTLGGFVHALFIGSHLTAGLLRWYWLALGLSGVVALIYRRCIPSYSYKVTNITVPATGVRHVTLEPTTKRKLAYVPGQFAFVQFQTVGITREWHPFTISSSPTDTKITFSMKASGDWTNSLTQLTVGAKARIEGPYGRFTYLAIPNAKEFVFIAGGIGITPLRSMIRTLVAEHDTRPITLIYNTKTEADQAFKDEFNGMPITVHYVANRYIGRDDLAAKAGNAGVHYFICGPELMMNATAKLLIGLGVLPQDIHTERFALK